MQHGNGRVDLGKGIRPLPKKDYGYGCGLWNGDFENGVGNQGNGQGLYATNGIYECEGEGEGMGENHGNGYHVNPGEGHGKPVQQPGPKGRENYLAVLRQIGVIP